MAEIVKDWAAYFERSKGAQPSPLLLRALSFAPATGQAVDIGAGALNETRVLLEKGYEVTAIDQEPAVATFAAEMDSKKLHCIIAPFESFEFPQDRFAVACSINALPFASQERFPKLLTDIKQSLIKDGIFCGQIFGDRHSWKVDQTMNFHDRAETEALFADMTILSFEEIERDGKDAIDEPMHWHSFAIIAKK